MVKSHFGGVSFRPVPTTTHGCNKRVRRTEDALEASDSSVAGPALFNRYYPLNPPE